MNKKHTAYLGNVNPPVPSEIVDYRRALDNAKAQRDEAIRERDEARRLLAEAVGLLRVLRPDAQRLAEHCCSLDGDLTFDAVRCYQETSSDVFAFLSRLPEGR